MNVPRVIHITRCTQPRSLQDALAGRVGEYIELAFVVRRLPHSFDIQGPEDATPEEYEAARAYLRSCISEGAR